MMSDFELYQMLANKDQAANERLARALGLAAPEPEQIEQREAA